MQSVSKLLLRMVPMMTVMGTIFFLSHQPAGSFQLPQLPYLDKIAHFFLYALLAYTTLFIVEKRLRRTYVKEIALAVLTSNMLFALSDEYHQSFIPGRDASIGDLMADFAGIVSVLAVWLYRNSTK